MPIKRAEELDWAQATIHIDGNEVSGIVDFDATLEPVQEYVEDNIKFTYNSESNTITGHCKVNKLVLFKLLGLWQWIVNHCPNKRVIHLAEYHKSSRVRSKNFNRALNLIAKTYYRN